MKILVLTPHAVLLPNQGEVLFSGGWCLTPDILREVEKQGLASEVLPYPWDDRAKYRSDYEYLSRVYEASLTALAATLNAVHRECHGLEYWRILAGPALYTLLCHLIDRWNIAQSALNHAAFDVVPMFQFPAYRFTPRMTIDLDPDNHEYNHFLMASALTSLGLEQARIRRMSYAAAQEAAGSAKPKPARSKHRRAILLLAEGVGGLLGLTRRARTFIVDSYLSKPYELALTLGCFGVPVNPRPPCAPLAAVETDKRASLRFELNMGDPFSRFVETMLPILLPTYLLEGYAQLGACWQAAGWAEKPRSIFTSNAFQFNEVFQHYAATKHATGETQLLIGQHGGVTGILAWSFAEDHQVGIADRFVSWGWGGGDPKIVPGFVLTNLGKRIKPASDGNLLLATVPMRRYSHKGGAWPVGPNQSEAFLADQLNFYGALDAGVADRTVLRIFEAQDHRFRSGYVPAWRARFPQIKVDDSTSRIALALKKARLFVYTYNSTGYLECLSMNFPTVMFWNPALFETNPAFTTALGRLEQVGIYHRTPEAAAAHVNRVWNAIDAWWLAPDVQTARREFIDQFARPPSAGWFRFFQRLLRGYPQHPISTPASLEASTKETSSVQ